MRANAPDLRGIPCGLWGLLGSEGPLQACRALPCGAGLIRKDRPAAPVPRSYSTGENWGEGPFDIPPAPWSQSRFMAPSPILLPFTKLFVLFPTR